MSEQNPTPTLQRQVPEPAELTSAFPQYEIQSLLGRGGMGAVYRARHRKLDRLVAIKILLPDLEGDPEFAERFEREARAMARLSHPGIVMIHDFGKESGFFYLVLEHVDGASLRQLIADGTLSPRDALGLVPQICDALQFAHDAGIVHRDIKPENILVDQDGRARIADFGLAKMTGAQHPTIGLTRSDQAMGTPHYMAPEQIGGAGRVDHRADIYSLGVMLYEMLTGELPIGRFGPPSEKSQAGPKLDEVVMKSLESEPEKRYQQAREVKSELGEAEASHPTPIATHTKRPTDTPARSRRHRTVLLQRERARTESLTPLAHTWTAFGLLFLSLFMRWGTGIPVSMPQEFGFEFDIPGGIDLTAWTGHISGIPLWFVGIAALVIATSHTLRWQGRHVPRIAVVVPALYGAAATGYIIVVLVDLQGATPGLGAYVSSICFGYWLWPHISPTQRAKERRRAWNQPVPEPRESEQRRPTPTQ